jgi:Tfp pilus assembly protein PilV
MNIDKRRIVRRPAQRARGFSIIEALIAALVLSFGMMAIAGMQIGMSRNADVSKQRTEATRLAQQRMEQLRSWVGRNAPNMRYNLASLGVTGSTANAVLPVRDTVVGDNATFTRDWSVLGDSANLRQMVVTVTWRDRTEEEHTVTLNSVIATASQTDAGVIAASPVGGVGPSLTGRNQRDNRVPYDAVSIGTGRSTYRWPGTGQPWLVFDDTNANILYRCAAQPTSVTDLAASCLAIRGYVLAGYLSRADATWPTPVNLCGLTSAANVASVNCFVQDVILGTGFNLSVNGACPYVSLDSVRRGSRDVAVLAALQVLRRVHRDRPSRAEHDGMDGAHDVRAQCRRARLSVERFQRAHLPFSAHGPCRREHAAVQQHPPVLEQPNLSGPGWSGMHEQLRARERQQ